MEIFNYFIVVHFERIIFLIFKNQSIYFDEPNPTRAKDSSPEGLPDWVVGELGTSGHKLNESWKLASGEDYSLLQLPTDVHRYAMNMGFRMCFIIYPILQPDSYIPFFSLCGLFYGKQLVYFIFLLRWRAVKDCWVGKITVLLFHLLLYFHSLFHLFEIILHFSHFLDIC